MKKWSQFIEEKSNYPEQGKGANPYMPLGKQSVGVRVAKDTDKKEPLGHMGGSNVKPEDSSLGEKGGKGGVPITEDKMKSNYPDSKYHNKLRVTKDKEKGKDYTDLKTPGMEPSTSSLGQSPKKADVTTEMSVDDYIESVLKKKEINESHDDDDDDFVDCDLDDDFVDDFSGQKVYVPIVKVISRTAKSLMKNAKAPKLFVREVKRIDGGLPKLIEELLTHPETFNELAGHIRTNENKSAKKLVKAMHQHYLDYLSEMGMLDEGVSPPMNKRLEDPDEKLHDGFGGAGALTAGGQGVLPGGAGGPSMAGPGANMNVANPDIFSGMNARPQVPGELGAFSGFNPQGGGMAKPSMVNANANKEFGYHHMIKEMGSYDNMKKAMSEYLGG